MNHYPKRCVCIVDMHFSNNNKSLHLCQAISNLVVPAVQNVPHTSRHRLLTHTHRTHKFLSGAAQSIFAFIYVRASKTHLLLASSTPLPSATTHRYVYTTHLVPIHTHTKLKSKVLW